MLLYFTIQRIARDTQQLGCLVYVPFCYAHRLGYGFALQLLQVQRALLGILFSTL